MPLQYAADAAIVDAGYALCARRKSAAIRCQDFAHTLTIAAA